MKRVVFWVIFLMLATGAFVYLWKTKDPLRNNPYLLERWTRYNVELLAHPHPAVAYTAWMELWNLYFTKWAVYDTLPRHVADTRALSFLIEREQFPAAGDTTPAVNGFMAREKPYFYKTDRIYCRTVGEALLAIMYREKKWRTDYEGDWKAWWEANKRYY